MTHVGGRPHRRTGLWFISLFLFSSVLCAFEGRLVQPDGTPAAGYEVSVVGRQISVTTDAEGRFRFVPSPAVPFELIAIGPGGELSPPIAIPQVPESGEVEIPLPATFRDSVTVASGVAGEIEASPAAATVTVGQESLEQRRPQRLFEALEGVAGVSRTDETASGVPMLRNAGRGRTLILLDGARVTTERRAGPSATFLDPFTLASIEVARGAGSVAYGSDAFGGVINAVPRYPERGRTALRFDLSQAFLAGDESAGGVEVSTDLLGGALLGAFHIREAGISEAGDGEEIVLSSYRDRGAALRYAAQLPAGQLRVGFAANDAYDVGKPASDSATIPTIYPEENSRRLNVGFETGPRGSWESFDFDLFLGTYGLILDRDRLASGTTPRVIERSDVDSNDGSIRAKGSRPLFGGRFQVGAELVSRFGLEAITGRRLFDLAGVETGSDETVSIDEAERNDAAVFTTWDRAVAPKALLSVGLRGDRVESKNRGGFFGDRSTKHDALSGQVALTVGPFADTTASLQVARGFRDPLLSDRYFRGPSGRGFVTGNPDLDPETSLQYDAALRWARGGRSVSLFAYHYEIDDLIERFRPARDFFFRNRGEAEIRGVELEAQALLGAGFGLEVAAAVARGEALDDDSPLDDVAPPNGSATLRWTRDRGYAYLRGALYLEDDRPGPTEVDRPSYSTWDLGAGWQIVDALELRLIGRNLTDERYHDGGDEVASLARGRTVSLGLVGRL